MIQAELQDYFLDSGWDWVEIVKKQKLLWKSLNYYPCYLLYEKNEQIVMMYFAASVEAAIIMNKLHCSDLEPDAVSLVFWTGSNLSFFRSSADEHSSFHFKLPYAEDGNGYIWDEDKASSVWGEEDLAALPAYLSIKIQNEHKLFLENRDYIMETTDLCVYDKETFDELGINYKFINFIPLNEFNNGLFSKTVNIANMNI